MKKILVLNQGNTENIGDIAINDVITQFFVSKDFRYGLLGHPWRKEIYVFGDTLIEQFKQNEELLNIIQNDL